MIPSQKGCASCRISDLKTGTHCAQSFLSRYELIASTVELLKRLPPLMQAAKEWSCRVGLKNSQTYVRVKGLFKVGLATCTWTVDDLFALISNAMPWGLRSRHLETASVSNMDVGHSLALEVLTLAAFLEALWLFPHKEKRCTLQITSG